MIIYQEPLNRLFLKINITQLYGFCSIVHNFKRLKILKIGILSLPNKKNPAVIFFFLVVKNVRVSLMLFSSLSISEHWTTTKTREKHNQLFCFFFLLAMRRLNLERLTISRKHQRETRRGRQTEKSIEWRDQMARWKERQTSQIKMLRAVHKTAKVTPRNYIELDLLRFVIKIHDVETGPSSRGRQRYMSAPFFSFISQSPSSTLCLPTYVFGRISLHVS